MRKSVVFAVVGCLLLVGCGGKDDPGADGSASPATTEPATALERVEADLTPLTGAARTARLLELARAETGPLSFYTIDSADTVQSLADAFERAYGLKAAIYRTDNSAVLQRVGQEQAAGVPGADVVCLDGVSIVALDRSETVEEVSPQVPELVAGSSHPAWTAYSTSTFVVAWNTDLVSPEAAPKAWEDLADPRWKGKLALEVNDWPWFAGLRTYFMGEGGKSAEEADRLFEAMASNALVVKGHTLMGQLLASGEVEVVASQFLSLVQKGLDAGAPIAWQPAVQPTLAAPNGIGIVKGSTRPATALLFVEWLLGPGQDELLRLDKEPTRADLAAGAPARRVLLDIVALADQATDLTDRYDRLVSQGQAR